MKNLILVLRINQLGLGLEGHDVVFLSRNCVSRYFTSTPQLRFDVQC